ncbi:MAG: hypothetical protein DI606_16650 [Sphingobium sp.]|uniref:hypothetical protein n=1 Tax=Sphingobium sp. TaxID=1912891 RepID=UPI000DB71529|nr:hypothetical protein [Sphingobium sp.]PZU07392.1 MAG: hypothetical protein DI606_16650 [Sphingobium sp.]
MIEFDEQHSLGYRSDAEIADYLEYLGDTEEARTFREAAVRGQGMGDWLAPPWKQTSHVFGFIDEGSANDDLIAIKPAFHVDADHSLIGQQIKVTLDAFQVHSYPGLGTHKILFDFQGRDQAGSEAQDLQFATVLYATDKARAGMSGVPIFTGLTVPQDGLSFKVRTGLIGNSGDQIILDTLQSSVFKDGLKLMGTIQPALPQLVALAGGITQNLLKRDWNKQVQSFNLGLDFSNSRTSARLRRGSYVVVQVPGESMWRWNDWAFDPHTMSVVNVNREITPHNTIVFAISASSGVEARSGIRNEGRMALDAIETNESGA